MRSSLLLLLALSCAACGSSDAEPVEPEPEPTPAEACAHGELEVDGSCLPAGIAEDECPEGFVPDGAWGCRAAIVECGAGQVAWLGETACHAVGSCAAGRWAEPPAGAGVLYVDGGYAGNDSDGTAERPYTSLQPAFDAAAPNTAVMLAAGTYAEDAVMRADGLTLVGTCAEQVRLTGVDPARPALFVNGAHGGAIRGVTVSGPGFGVAVQDVTGFTIEEVVVSEVGANGLFASPALSSDLVLTVRRLLVESAVGKGIYVGGGEVTLEDVVIRDVALDAEGAGDGLSMSPAAGLDLPIAVTAERVVVTDAARSGALANAAEVAFSHSAWSRVGLGEAEARALWLGDGSASFDGCTVDGFGGIAAIAATDVDLTLDRVTLVDGQVVAESPAVGLFYVPVERTSPSLTLRRTTIANVHTMGLVAANASTTIERLRIAGVGDDPIGMAGAGMAVSTYLGAGFGDGVATIDARGLVLTDTPRIGLAVYGAEARFESAAVGAVRSDAAGIGRCVDIEIAVSQDHRADVILEGADIGPCQEGGLFLFGSALQARDLTIHDVSPVVGATGYGLSAHWDPVTFDRASGSLAESRIERVTLAGAFVSGGANFDIRDTRIVDVVTAADGSFGDGVVVSGSDGPEGFLTSTSTVTSCDIESVARAAIASFGGVVTIEGNDLSCNPIALNHEPLAPGDGFVNGGANACGCDAEEACKALSSTLAAPEPPSPAGGSF